MNELNLDDLTPIEVPVSLGGKKYLLREATEAAAATYRNASVAGATLGSEGGETRITGLPPDIGGLQSLLVSLCLWELNADGKPTRTVPRAVVKTWPARMVRPLFDKAQEISGLKEEEAGSENPPQPGGLEATTDG